MKERYTNKVGLVGIQEEHEPYSERSTLRFISWPPIEYGHIYCYFVLRPGLYTQQELMQWKSLQAYNYLTLLDILSMYYRFLRDVRVWIISPELCILCAYVNPSMISPEKPHDAWVAVRVDVTAHCKCMSG